MNLPLESVDVAVLAAMSFLGSFITAAMGIGGGILLIAVMATLMQATAVIPVHGVVQLGSNAGRAILQWSYVDWRTYASFAIGSIGGVAGGGSVAVTLPGEVLRVVLALFILFSIWGPRLQVAASGQAVVVAVGAVASFLTMFFGATGACISAILTQRDYAPRRMVATQSVCMGSQHALKTIAFGLLGFAYADWLGLIAVMIVAGFI